MPEIWKEWKPLDNIPERIYLEELRDNSNGLTLIFKGEVKNLNSLVILFESVLSYRNHNEGDLLKTLGERTTNSSGPLFTIESSNYLSWFNQESFHIHDGQGIVHYIFITPDDVIDVLSTDPPSVCWTQSVQ